MTESISLKESKPFTSTELKSGNMVATNGEEYRMTISPRNALPYMAKQATYDLSSIFDVLAITRGTKVEDWTITEMNLGASSTILVSLVPSITSVINVNIKLVTEEDRSGFETEVEFKVNANEEKETVIDTTVEELLPKISEQIKNSVTNSIERMSKIGIVFAITEEQYKQNLLDAK